MAYKCRETLVNKGLSGTLCFDETPSATRYTMQKRCKKIVANGYEVKKGARHSG